MTDRQDTMPPVTKRRYRLPEVLGGGEVVVVSQPWQGDAIVCEVSPVDDPSIRIGLARELLTEVKPPLPPEPESGIVVCDGYLWNRQGRPRGSSYSGGDQILSWAELCGRDTPVPYVSARPVALPMIWTDADGADGRIGGGPGRFAAVIAVSDHGGDGYVVGLTVEEARCAARALWTAADSAEAVSTDER